MAKALLQPTRRVDLARARRSDRAVDRDLDVRCAIESALAVIGQDEVEEFQPEPHFADRELVSSPTPAGQSARATAGRAP